MELKLEMRINIHSNGSRKHNKTHGKKTMKKEKREILTLYCTNYLKKSACVKF